MLFTIFICLLSGCTVNRYCMCQCQCIKAIPEKQPILNVGDGSFYITTQFSSDTMGRPVPALN